MKFRQRVVIVDAVQWVPGVAIEGVHPFTNEWASALAHVHTAGLDPQQCAWFPTQDGGHILEAGDWIITEPTGRRYRCRPNIFEAIYEPVGEGESR